jgi:hypothetical protein
MFIIIHIKAARDRGLYTSFNKFVIVYLSVASETFTQANPTKDEAIEIGIGTK